MLAQMLLILVFVFKSIAFAPAAFDLEAFDTEAFDPESFDPDMMEEEAFGLERIKPCRGRAFRNIARNMPASKSSSYRCYPCSDCSASKANDGNNEGIFSPYCTTSITNREEKAWWEVDLVYESIISGVVVYNNVDRCSYCLQEFDIIFKDINQTVVRTVTEVQGGLRVMSYMIKPVVLDVRYVRVQLRYRNFLLLSEVEVFGLNKKYAERNVARNKPASQSSTSDDDCHPEAWKAVDGNNEGAFHPWCSTSQTNPNEKEAPWWEVDLKKKYVVNSVDVYNRVDCCMEDLANFNITLLSSTRSVLATQHFAGGVKAETLLFKMKSAVENVRSVRVHFLKPGTLALAEVKVWGHIIKPKSEDQV